MVNGAKYWTFTLHDYTEEDEALLLNLPILRNELFGYIGFGHETCPSTGRLHLQGHFELTRKQTLVQLRRLLPSSIHLEVRRGSFEENEDYLGKEDLNPVRCGSRISKGRGKRSDLDTACEMLMTGSSLLEVSEECFGTFIRYHRGLEKFMSLRQTPRDFKSTVIIFHGPTGTGKTRRVYEENPETPIYPHPEGPWFDGYCGQEIALFDDFHGGVFKLPYLLKLLDRYPMQVPIKGSFVHWKPKKIYFTSNLNPTDWFPHANQHHIDALFRRIDIIEEML